jgi:hypothetical protein
VAFDIDGVNLHTWAFTKLVLMQYDDFVPKTLADIVHKPPRGVRVHHDPTFQLDVGTDDYEEAGLTPLGAWFVDLVNRLPTDDRNVRYRSVAEAERELTAIFGARIVREVDWKDPTGDAALVKLVTQGLGAHTLVRGDEPNTWVSDLSYALDYAVRPGFLRYGAKLVLEEDAHGALVPRSIAWVRGESGPDDGDDWEQAKLAYRVTLAFVATVRDHAVGCHFLPANAMVIATRTKLPITHPVRQMLRAFQFRTPAINSGALVTLVPPRAIFSRLFALEWHELKRFYAHAKGFWRWRTLPQLVDAHGTRALGARHPYTEDAVEMYAHEHRFVTEYLDAIGMRARPADDPELAAFHRELVRILPKTAEVPPIETKAELADLLAAAIWSGTGWHEQAGGAIADYLARPDFVVPTMRDAATFEEMLPSKQTMVQGMMLGILTNFTMPEINANFAPLVPKAAEPVVMRWIDGLGVLKKTIDRRNAAREQRMPTFDPANVEISVSI